jgi:hypothetical protein
MHFISPVLWQFLVKWLTPPRSSRAEASTIAPYADALYFFLLAISVVGIWGGGDPVYILDPLPQVGASGGDAD